MSAEGLAAGNLVAAMVAIITSAGILLATHPVQMETALQMALGLLVNVGLRRPILLSRRPFEFGDKKEIPPAPYGPLAGDGKGGGKPQ